MEEKKLFDFTGNQQFDLNAEYDALFQDEQYKPANANEAKLKDAEDIINEFGGLYLESTSLSSYENAYNNLNEFLTRFRTDSDEVIAMTESDRSKLFGYGKELFSSYNAKYSSICFNFELSRNEWKYIEHTLTKKLSYNGNEIFNFWELYTKFIAPTNTIFKDLPKTIESFTPVSSIHSFVLLYHLLMKHEEKGGSDSFNYFRIVLAEIGKMTKLFNAYGVILERVTNQFQNWVNSINIMDGYNNDNREQLEIKPEAVEAIDAV